jgi:hypothetical protein
LVARCSSLTRSPSAPQTPPRRERRAGRSVAPAAVATIPAIWEQSDKPPGSDAIPKLARALGVRVEDLFTEKTSLPGPSGPVGKVRKLFDEVAKLPRRQQDKIVEFLAPIIEDFRRRAS